MNNEKKGVMIMSWLDNLGDGWKNISNVNTDLQTEDVEDINVLIKEAQ